MKEIVLRAPATIANFGPGFDIFSLALENPCDTIKIRQNTTNSIAIKVAGMAEGIPASVEKNTAGVAAIHFFEKIGLRAGADIEIIKKMTSCAGLGSSAASAVASVYGLNKLFGSNLDSDEIIEIAAKGETASGSVAHADNVAGCLLGGFIFLRNLHPPEAVKIEVPKIPIVIRIMKKPQQTTRGLIPGHMALSDVKEQMASCADLIHAILSGDLRRIGRAVNRDYISEPVRSRFIPGYDVIKTEVLEAGAYGCNISGGGSSMFALCPEDRTEEIAEIMNASQCQQGDSGNALITHSSNAGISEIEINEL